MAQLRCLALWLNANHVSLHWPQSNFEINIPLRCFVNFLVLKCYITLIQSESRGDKIYMVAGTSSPLLVMAYDSKHLGELEVKKQG